MHVHYKRDGIATFDATTEKVFRYMSAGNHPHVAFKSHRMLGIADNVVTLYLGYGRTRVGRVGVSTPQQPVGFNVYPLRFADAPWYATGAQVTATGDTYQLVGTQLHFAAPP